MYVIIVVDNGYASGHDEFGLICDSIEQAEEYADEFLYDWAEQYEYFARQGLDEDDDEDLAIQEYYENCYSCVKESSQEEIEAEGFDILDDIRVNKD